MKDAVIKQLTILSVSERQATALWNQQRASWQQTINEDGVMHIFRRVNGLWVEFAKDSFTLRLAEALAKAWKEEFVDAAIKTRTKYRTRDDASSQPVAFSPQQTQVLQDMIALAVPQVLQQSLPAIMPAIMQAITPVVDQQISNHSEKILQLLDDRLPSSTPRLISDE